jgi:NAD(P)-dependent dehydrogenase (short-subunit alcohol dehydrogenase family)
MNNDNKFAAYASLRGRRVLVTGGASGIGASMVEHFFAQGAQVAFLDRDAGAARALVQRLAGQGSAGPTFAECDLRDIAALREAISALATTLGPFEALVNNAARDDRHEFADLEPEYWDECLNTNLRHQIFAAQAVAPGMRANGGGSIIMFGSVSWMRGRAGFIGYTSSKAAINGATRTLARELGGDRIRVNCIVPGLVMTERQTKWFTPEALAQHVAQQSVPYALRPGDIARMALFLAADDSRGCTGQNFIVDAGIV